MSTGPSSSNGISAASPAVVPSGSSRGLAVVDVALLGAPRGSVPSGSNQQACSGEVGQRRFVSAPRNPDPDKVALVKAWLGRRRKLRLVSTRFG